MYLKNDHFKSIIWDNAKQTRVSSKAIEYQKERENWLVYVNTIVFKHLESENCIFLNSNWRQTATTKKHINNKIKRFGLSLYQKAFKRYVSKRDGSVVDFEDNMLLSV